MNTVPVLLKEALKNAWSRANDCYLGIATGVSAALDPAIDPERPWTYVAQIDTSAHKDSVNYQPAEYLGLRRALKLLRPGGEDVFYDIGCGKGRVVCLAARGQLRRVVGIEMSATLCALARDNVARLHGRQTPVEIRCEDAVRADLSDGTIYFLYNPFGAETMRGVLENIHLSLDRNPRKVRFAYYNPRCEQVFQACQWLRFERELRTWGRGRVSFWASVA